MGVFMVGAVAAAIVFFVTECSWRINAQTVIAAAGANTCAILTVGTTKCWGFGNYVGLEGGGSRGATPSTMGSLLPAINWGGSAYVASHIYMGGSPDTGDTTTCGIVYDANLGVSDSHIKCFGDNVRGKAGRGISSVSPGDILGNNLNEMSQNQFNATNVGTGLIPRKIAVGLKHACAIVYNATVFEKVKCWGANSDADYAGALGNGETTDRGESAAGMGDKLPFMLVTPKVLDIAAGSGFTCVIASDTSTTDGDVYCTGYGNSGRTGQGSQTSISTPAPVDIGTGKTARKIVAGLEHACVLVHQDSKIKCWGSGIHAANGQDTTDNVGDVAGGMGDDLGFLEFGTTVKDIVAGSFHTCVILTTNAIKCFGFGGYGALGYGSVASGETCYLPCSGFLCCNVLSIAQLPDVNLGTGVVVQSLAAGGAHTCAIVTGSTFSGNRLKCWGFAGSGQLGLESTTNYGDSGTAIGDAIPFVNIGEPTSAPSKSPTTSRPSANPTKSPTTSRPSRSPSTSRPSTSPTTSRPSRSPSTSRPSKSPSKSPTGHNVITGAPTNVIITSAPLTGAPTTIAPSTLAPTNDASAAAQATIGAAVGSVAGITVLLLASFVVYRRRDSLSEYLFGSKLTGAVPKNWLDEAMKASPDEPPQLALVAAANAAAPKKQDKFNLPAEYLQSGNPIYSGLKQESSVRLSTGATAAKAPVAAPGTPAKLTKGMVFEKLVYFYSKVDPNKKMNDIDDLARWVVVHGEEALYVKLRKKYGADPNTINVTPGESQSRLKLGEDIDV